MDAPTERMVLDLERGEPLAGWLSSDATQPVRFDGLLELVALVDQLRADGPTARDADAPADE